MWPDTHAHKVKVNRRSGNFVILLELGMFANGGNKLHHCRVGGYYQVNRMKKVSEQVTAKSS